MELTATSQMEKFIEKLEIPGDKDAYRSAAKAAFLSQEFPTSKVEDWKYTKVNKLAKKEWKSPTSFDEILEVEAFDGDSILMINGVLQDEFLPDDVDIDEASTPGNWDNDIFDNLNAAYHLSSLHVKVNKNSKREAPLNVYLVYTEENTYCPTQLFVHAEQGSKAEINFFVINDESSNFIHHITDVKVEENANIEINKIHQGNEASFEMFKEYVDQADGSQFQINTLCGGKAWIRNNVNIDVNGQNCTSNMYGVYAGSGKQHIDNHTRLDHKVPNCLSNELYKGVMDDDSTAVFNGKVFVREDAQKINAFQQNSNVLLSDGATVNTKPELEIYADDVKCSHGSATGQMDEESVFYLRARGIGEREAKRILVNAFAEEVFEFVSNEQIREYMSEAVQNKLA